jgi:hypothetical protein
MCHSLDSPHPLTPNPIYGNKIIAIAPCNKLICSALVYPTVRVASRREGIAFLLRHFQKSV